MERTTILNGGMSNMGLTSHVPSLQNDLPYEIIHYKEGDVLFREGEQPRGLYFAQSGCVKVVMTRKQSRGRTTSSEYVTKLVGPGEYFGYASLIKNGSTVATAKAIKSTTVWLYPRETIQAVLRQANPLIRMVMQQMVGDLQNHEDVSQLHYLASVEERIAYQLVLMADKFGIESANGVSLNLKLTRNEFAQLASTINESLSRHLTDFKNEGLIELNGKEIIIKNKQALMSKSGNFQASPAQVSH